MTLTNGSGDTAWQLQRISFAFHDQGLVGTGMGPVGTSLSEGGNGYQRLATWRDRLDGAVAPELPHEYSAPSYWYRRFDDGQGALLRRLPEPAPSDRRGSRAQALVGEVLNVPMAILLAMEAWPGAHEWLSAPRDTDQGWACVPPFSSAGLPEEVTRRLEREAAARRELVPLVARLLRDPASPVDIPVPEGAPGLDEQGRLLLLWGAYRTLMDVLGTEREPRRISFDWSFSTYEPWPERGTATRSRPTIAFRPPEPGPAGAFTLDVLDGRSAPHTETARWLIGHLDAGTRAEATGFLRGDREAGHTAVLEQLQLARFSEERRPARPAEPDTEPVAEPAVEPTAEADRTRPRRPSGRPPRDDPGRTRPPAPRAPDDQGGLRDRLREEPARPGGAAGRRPEEGPHRAPGRPSPGGRRSPGDAPGWRQHDRPAGTDHERLFAEALIQSPPPPGAPPPMAPTPTGPVGGDLSWLLEELRRTRDPNRIGELATLIVEHQHPGFSRDRRLVARGLASEGWVVHPAAFIGLVVLVVLLAVCLLFALV